MGIISFIKDGIDNLIDWAYQKRFDRYAALLLNGRVRDLVNQGKVSYVINHFRELSVEGKPQTDKDAYAPFVLWITPAMMRNYLHRSPRDFHFFTMHPLGLRILDEEGFSGAIACMEKEFLAIGKNFPESFKIYPGAQKEYIELLNKQLEVSLPLPEE